MALYGNGKKAPMKMQNNKPAKKGKNGGLKNMKVGSKEYMAKLRSMKK